MTKIIEMIESYILGTSFKGVEKIDKKEGKERMWTRTLRVDLGSSSLWPPQHKVSEIWTRNGARQRKTQIVEASYLRGVKGARN